MPPPCLTFRHPPRLDTGTDGFADRRIKLLRGGVRTLLFRPALPAVLAENSETCPTAPGSGHRVLPDGSEWAVSLLSEVADVAAARRPYKYHPRMTSKPSQRFRWLLPVVIAAQVVFYKKVRVRVWGFRAGGVGFETAGHCGAGGVLQEGEVWGSGGWGVRG